MAEMKVVVIGGGSYQWSPTIIKDILLTRDLYGSTIVLHDIDPEPLEIIYKLAKKMVRDLDVPFKIVRTVKLAKALEGADFVILTISTGGLEAMRADLEIPERYGIYQSVGDTVGPGGLSRALRNIPVVADIAKKVEKIAPDAWFINYTNPMTTLTRTINKMTNLKTIGLCHELFFTIRMFKKMFKVRKDSDIELKVAGINHLPWILEMKVKGQDGFNLLSKYERKHGIPSFAGVRFELFNVFGYFLYAGDRHVAEFFPYFLTDETDKGAKYGVELTSVDERWRWYRLSKKAALDMLEGRVKIKRRKSQEAVSDIISSIANNKKEVHIVNYPNRGQIANLPKDVVVECFAYVGTFGVEPLTVGELPTGVLNTLHRHILNQEMIVEAALNGDKNLALQALLNDPLVQDFASARKMLDEMLVANRRYLPQFFKE